MRLELHHAPIFSARNDGIAKQRAARAHHVQARFGYFQGGEGVGRVQGDFLAIELGHVHQPGRLFVEGCQALAYVVLILHREVGHDCDHFQIRYLCDCHGVFLALFGGHFHAVTAHAA
ncbi:hypothetical protein D3C85_1364160 [compost metagenome]